MSHLRKRFPSRPFQWHHFLQSMQILQLVTHLFQLIARRQKFFHRSQELKHHPQQYRQLES